MNSFSKILTRFAGWTGIIVVILATIFSSGCSSMDKPASASFASVVIANQNIGDIKQAVLTVFQQNGYRYTGIQGDYLVFEREATRREQIDYAGFAGTQQGEQVDIRVKVTITPQGPAAYRLSCKAYAVCNPGQGVFENSTPLFGFQSGTYQDLLNNVKNTMKATESP